MLVVAGMWCVADYIYPGPCPYCRYRLSSMEKDGAKIHIFFNKVILPFKVFSSRSVLPGGGITRFCDLQLWRGNSFKRAIDKYKNMFYLCK